MKRLGIGRRRTGEEMIVATLGMLFFSVAQAGPMTTSGSFDVSPSGAATYTIPIQVPPGTGGMEPKLALVYNSQSGNGLLGVGWSLSGLSAISRCPRTLAQDGVRGSVNFDANDRYCLDGQRLININGANGGGGTEYRTELESYNRIVSYGSAGNGPAWFKVWTKAGQIIEYGNTADSRIEAVKASGTATWPTGTVRTWAMNGLSDTKGNYFTVTYTEDGTNGDFHPNRIDYTGNSNTGLVPNNSVQFVYEARTDTATAYHAGSFTKNIVRLSKLKAFAGSTLTREQRVTYETGASTARSRVKSMTECATASLCQAPVVLTSSETDQGFTSTQSQVFEWSGPYNFSGYSYQFPDLNGDGKSDLAILRAENGKAEVLYRLSNGNGFDAQQQVIDWSGYDYSGHRFQFADVNGDGLSDLIITRAESGRAEVDFRIGTGSGFGASQQVFEWSGPYNFSGYSYQFPDINGDGRADLAILRAENGKAEVLYRLSNGNGFDAQQQVIDWSGYDYSGHRFQFADVNGDGLSDLIITRAESGRAEVDFRIGTGSGFGASQQVFEWSGPYDFSHYSYQFPDINGDSKADLAILRAESGKAEVLYRLSNGLSFEAQQQVIDWSGSYDYSSHRFQFADVNGDGLPDLIITRSENGRAEVNFRLWTGSGFGASQQVFEWSGPYDYSGHSYQFPDINGDGRTDLAILRAESGRAEASYRLGFSPAPDRLSSVATGLGATTNLGYVPLTDNTVYTKATSSTYPQIDLQMPMYVVSSVSSSNGIGSTVTTNYKYGGLKAELGTGRGLLGFAWTEMTNAEMGITVRTDYRQDWPFTGLPSQVKKTLAGGGNNGVLSLVSTSYDCFMPRLGGAAACTVSTGDRYFPYASQNVETSWDLNGAALPTVTTTNQFDPYGNATQITVSTGDGYSKTTTNTYANDVVNWYLGRLLRSTVTSATP